MATKEQVEVFLKEMRVKIKTFDIAFRQRDKNLDLLAVLDIVPIARFDFLNKLTSENYYTGPNKDTHDTKKPDYYEFGMIIKGIEVYIKISLVLPNKMVDCMSFHKAERIINFPLKNKKL